MNELANDLRVPPHQLRLARTQLHDRGEVAPGLVPERLARSWQRSLAHGLAPAGRTPGAPHASGPQLARALAQQHELVAHARPVMELLAEHTAGTDSLVVLADEQGMVLHALGEGRFADRAGRVALRPGAIWHERWRGTNAIGTVLADAAPTVIHGAEHFLDRNGFLTCTAAPILDGMGRVLGVLDVSGERRSHHPHTLGLVRSAAGMIEHRLFDTRHGRGLCLRLHPTREGLGTVAEGRLAVSPDGWLIGATARALPWLGLDWAEVAAQHVGALLGLNADALHEWARQGRTEPVRLPGGRSLWLQAELRDEPLTLAAPVAAPRLGVEAAAQTAAADADPLSRLDRGDPAYAQVLQRARRVLDKPIALLLLGESGTGKEVLARAVHEAGARQAGPFVAVNCAALPETLIESELFGYRGGAYTGARRDGAPGRIREAEGGTLFLDEVGDMPLPLQARLLRVLQERAVTPLGGGPPVAVDFRLVCATHRDLQAAVHEGRFREDLYYRIAGLTLRLPPLRERTDFTRLLEDLLATLGASPGCRPTPELLDAMLRYRWPGNLRQLHNALQTACAMLDEGQTLIDWPHLPDDLIDELRHVHATPAHAGAEWRRGTARSVDQVLQACDGNRAEAARRIGISRNTLYRWLRERA